ncbi:uncharacterized protein LOC115624584 [Scaptodrosophila lebanonensis]|uniref:Uncharacterized protein LOC115624584 n=1 Tax=Drosophila lebanonensis TaxID=7225 RepID=A0A6J2TJJ2_DROLE|nr:uncharacterized protein LOC115624584 [Scaptodrosophila lebanonensis]
MPCVNTQNTQLLKNSKFKAVISSNKMKHSSQTTLGTSFFDAFWPLIIDENICHIESKSVEFFVSERPFCQRRWHTLLAKAGYPNYFSPFGLRCCDAATKEEESEEDAEKKADEAAERISSAAHADYDNYGSVAVPPLDQHVKHKGQERERRQKLAYEFANRKYPWTMQAPTHELGFSLKSELCVQFYHPMELSILRGIHDYQCKLMIIDAGTELCIDDFKRWIKFRPFIQMLVLVRCPLVERHLQLLKVFQTLLVEENKENNWHDELQCSVRTGLKHAKKLELFKNCADAFVFVFSRFRGICTCDTFKIMQRY